MSSWTHIAAVIDVDTNIISKNLQKKVEELLSKAPKITGSEGDADVFINVLSGYNYYTSSDCRECKYGESFIENESEEESCDADEFFICPSGNYQTRVVITILGDQRDRMREQTKKEYKEFMRFIEKDCNFIIRNKSVKILGN